MSTVNESKSATMRRWRPTTRQIIAAVIALAALLLIVQNTRTGNFQFLWFTFEAPVWLWLLVVFAGGVGTGLLIANRRARKARA